MGLTEWRTNGPQHGGFTPGRAVAAKHSVSDVFIACASRLVLHSIQPTSQDESQALTTAI